MIGLVVVSHNRKLAEEKFDRKKTYNQIVKTIEGN